MIEGDCLILVENLQQASKLAWEFMPQWKSLLKYLQELQEWQLNICRRSRNQVADALAKVALPTFTIFRTFLPP